MAERRPAYRVFDEQGNVLVAAVGHDDPDRAAGRDPLRAR